MTDFNIEEHFETIGSQENPLLEEKLLTLSSNALAKSHRKRKMIHQSLLTVAVLLIGCVGFLAGRLSSKSTDMVSPRVHANGDDIITIQVHKDFLAWVDAGQFFNQIDMKDRATYAFDQAIGLLPKSEAPPNDIYTAKLESVFASLLSTENSKLLANTSLIQIEGNNK